MTRAIWTRLADLASLVATPLAPSDYVALFAPLAAGRTRRARVEAVRDEAPGVRTLTLRPGRGWRAHRAGQHVRVGVAIDGRIATRTYSIASPPGRRDGCFEITVKAHPGGRVSRALVHDVEPGAFLAIGLPEGAFVLPAEAAARPLLFVSAGSGVTPIASMVRDLAARGALGEAAGVVHLHFERGARDEIFGAELRALAAAHPRYRRVVVHTADDPRRLDRARLDALVPDWRARDAWACGPHRLLEPLAACFEAAGRAGALRVERFGAARAVIPDDDAAGGEVTFAASRVRARAGGRSPLLRVAEDAGLAPPHGCRMGICHSCDATLVAGRVRDLRTGACISEPGARIQVCVCAAAGDVEVAL